MARERLTNKTAEDWMRSKPGTQVEDKGSGIDNDAHAMNNPDHEKNDPKYDAYAKGDPSAWAEDVDKSDLWKKDKRNEMHVPEMTSKQAAEAVAAAKKLEEKAIKCIVASQRMLPGATDELIEAQAADLMHLPENSVNATLTRQEELAKVISKAASDSAEAADEEEEKEEEEKEEVEAADEKEEEVEEEKEAAKEEEEEDDMEKMASAILSGDMSKLPPALQKAIEEKKKKSEEKEEEKEAATEEKEATEESVEAKEEEKEEKMEEEEAGKSCEASEETSLLDEIFSSVTASDNKKGAKTLKGMVKKEASEGTDPLNGIWGGAPDVSGVFK